MRLNGEQVTEKRLRNGYTTGTCAAAAAKAAAAFFAQATRQKTFTYSELTLPGGGSFRIPVIPFLKEGEPFCFGVQKDSGDDPDVTNQTLILASVKPVSRKILEMLKSTGSGYFLEEFPDLYLNGGLGIGMVTKPGLSCPVGHYAINPVPRSMILGAVDEVMRQTPYEECLLIEISIPDGERLASQTFNPKLGIQGGISVLGTTGIVKPMSEEALLETIRLEIHMKAVNGAKVLLMAPGNYGEEFLKKTLGVPVGNAVLCSNFAKAAVLMAQKEGFQSVLFVGHIGKLIKVSAGRENTHSKYGDGRMEQMAQLTEALGYQKLKQQILSCNTTDDALELLKQHGIAGKLLDLTAEYVKRQLEQWSDGKICAEVVTFSTAHQMFGTTTDWKRLFETWKRERS